MGYERTGIRANNIAQAAGICGLSPIYAFLEVIHGRGELLRYGQAPDPHGTVTFASLAFREHDGSPTTGS